MSQDKVSIPERAREIAERKHSDTCPLKSHEHNLCEEAIESLEKFVTDAMRSERELCIKRLAEYKETLDWPQSATVENCIELLRDGGHK